MLWQHGPWVVGSIGASSLDKQPSGNTSPSTVYSIHAFVIAHPTHSSSGAHAVKPVLGGHATPVD